MQQMVQFKSISNQLKHRKAVEAQYASGPSQEMHHINKRNRTISGPAHFRVVINGQSMHQIQNMNAIGLRIITHCTVYFYIGLRNFK